MKEVLSVIATASLLFTLVFGVVFMAIMALAAPIVIILWALGAGL